MVIFQKNSWSSVSILSGIESLLHIFLTLVNILVVVRGKSPNSPQIAWEILNFFFRKFVFDWYPSTHPIITKVKVKPYFFVFPLQKIFQILSDFDRSGRIMCYQGGQYENTHFQLTQVLQWQFLSEY